MKFTHVRHSLLTLICCCTAILFRSTATAAPDAMTWIQLSPVNSPPARSYLAMTYDPVSEKVIVFGGYDGKGYLNDTWIFDGISWARVTPGRISPPSRAAAQMAYDSVTHKVVLFGGYNGHYLGDTWLWDGTTSQWTRARPVRGPVAVTSPMLFPDPNGHVDLFGGFDGHFYQYTMWQWNGSNWKQLFPPMLPYARSSAAVAANSVTGEVVLFGGLADVNPINT